MDEEMVAASASMKRVLREIDAVAPFDVPVLLTGQTGTGKELAARRLHRASRRCHRAWVPVNCASLPDTLVESELFGHTRGAFTGADRRRVGLLEMADGGTLFIDEVADLSVRTQTTLLRVLQEKEYRTLGDSLVRRSDFRVVSASHKSLDDEVRRGRFRSDLLFRLRVVPIDLPALCERVADIAPLARHLTEVQAVAMGLRPLALTPEAVEILERYPWPGNVRELENEVIQSLVRARYSAAIGREHLSKRLLAPGMRRQRAAVSELERKQVEEALTLTRGNRTHAARSLGVSRQTLYRKLKRLRAKSS